MLYGFLHEHEQNGPGISTWNSELNRETLKGIAAMVNVPNGLALCMTACSSKHQSKDQHRLGCRLILRKAEAHDTHRCKGF